MIFEIWHVSKIQLRYLIGAALEMPHFLSILMTNSTASVCASTKNAEIGKPIFNYLKINDYKIFKVSNF